MKSSVAVSLVALALAGCAVFGNSKDRALRNNPSFREGYEDGCGAATVAGADLRDRTVANSALYNSDDIYRAGWSNGYETCRATNVTPGTAPGNGAISVPGPGH